MDPQPKCANCHHPRSFHRGVGQVCQAFGCEECAGWVEAEPVVQEPASVA